MARREEGEGGGKGGRGGTEEEKEEKQSLTLFQLELKRFSSQSCSVTFICRILSVLGGEEPTRPKREASSSSLLAPSRDGKLG